MKSLIKNHSYLPLLLGVGLFSLSSQLPLNIFLKGYVTVLEIQTLILLFYFWFYRQKKTTLR